MGTGTPGDRFTDDRHLYANDLDLFGRGSLFELLALTRTRAGEDALAAWLKAPAAQTEIRERQQAIAELTDSLDFREAISVVGTEAASIRSDWLVGWAEGPPVLSPGWLRYLAWAITAVFVVTLVLWLTTGNSTPMAVVLGIQIAFAWPRRKRVERVSHGADTAARTSIRSASFCTAWSASRSRHRVSSRSVACSTQRVWSPRARFTRCTGWSSCTTGSTTSTS